ncbi:MAG: TIGR02450 family Trp-rich protein [Oligoflexales bacterium]
MKKIYEIGSKWTSLVKVKGFRHYRVCGRRKGSKGELEIELMSALDRKVRFWLCLASFKNDSSWKQGWLMFPEN